MVSVRFIVLLFISVFSFLNAQNEKPKNIILLIGDGMGINYVGAHLLQNPDTPFKEFKTIGLSVTCSADNLITDSAAGATALATGYLTKNKYVSVDTTGQPLYSLFEVAKDKGLSTGVAVTVSVAHATPGAFLGHSTSRYAQSLIASQMVEKDFDVILGGGLKFFLPKSLGGEREDSLNLIDKLVNKGYKLSKSYSELLTVPESVTKLYALMENDLLPEAEKRNYTLGDLTKAAINRLKQNDKGFVLMVEGSQVDLGGHNNNQTELLAEMKDFSTAIREALDFAKADGNTLVVVTSDHETGGMMITKGDRDAKNLEMSFATTHHTPSLVAIFAYGPGEKNFSGIMNINQIGQKLIHFINPAEVFDLKHSAN